MAAATDQVRGTHHGRDTVFPAGLGGFDGCWKFGKADPVSGGCVHVIGCCVVMTGQDRAKAFCLGNRALFMDLTKLGLQPFQVFNVIQKFLIIHAALFGHIGAQRGQIAELTLARRMIHQADNTDTIIGAKPRQFL